MRARVGEQGRVGKADTNCTTPPVICGAVFFEVTFEAEGRQRVALHFSATSRVRRTSPGEVKKCSFSGFRTRRGRGGSGRPHRRQKNRGQRNSGRESLRPTNGARIDTNRGAREMRRQWGTWGSGAVNPSGTRFYREILHIRPVNPLILRGEMEVAG